MEVKDQIAKLVVEYYALYPELMREDILHTQEVVCYTRMIALAEGHDEDRVALLEIAAWLHDIGCPRSKELYGNSLPVNQQSVGREVSAELLRDIDSLSGEQKLWLSEVVGSHHQFKSAAELSFEPLFEADLIVNLLSGYHPREKAPMLYESMVRTEGGRELFRRLIGCF